MNKGTFTNDEGFFKKLGAMTAHAVDAIRINSLTLEERDGHTYFVKRRRAASVPVAKLANLFFPLTGGLVSVSVDLKEWQRREVRNYLRFNGDRFHASTSGEDTVIEEKLPGEDLRVLAARKKLTPHILEVAALEIERAHQFRSTELGGKWSHGDMQLGNVIYDPATDTARLIDFELRHNPQLPSAVRQADDLLVFLQDMMWRIQDDEWIPFAAAFLRAYGRPSVIAELKKHLAMPSGFAGIWWKIRANHFSGADIMKRMNMLAVALDAPETAPTKSRRRGKTRRSSAETTGLGQAVAAS